MDVLNVFFKFFAAVVAFIIVRIIFSHIRNRWKYFEDWIYIYQFYKIPEFDDNFQENQLYEKIGTYINSLASAEDSDFANLFSGKKQNEIVLKLEPNQIVPDAFLGAKISWTIEEQFQHASRSRRAFVLKIRKKDKRRILRPYLQHIHSVSADIEQNKKELKLFTNVDIGNERWKSVPFTHPATLDTIVMDADLKNKIRSDLENFMKSKQYYHRLGKIWKRSYLLYGPSGTGKSSFAAAAARFLNYNIYEIDLSRITSDSDLKMLLLQTTRKSVILVEDLDRCIGSRTLQVSSSGILNFMDGVISSCGEERVMIFTMNKKDSIDSVFLRPGRLDVHIYFPLCDFSAFKSLASSYLGLKEHKLFPNVEEILQNGATLSHAEISEIFIANRNSSTRALKSVINALQFNESGRIGRLSESRSVNERSDDGRDSGISTVNEFRKLYGLLKMKSCLKSHGFRVSQPEKEA